jgi:VPDSG-CTERM motif
MSCLLVPEWQLKIKTFKQSKKKGTNNMRLKLALAVVAAVAMCSLSAKAGFINGSISVQGTATLDALVPATTAFTGFGPSTVQLDSGDYAGIPIGTAVTMHPFNLTTQSQALWDIGGWSFTTSTLTATQSLVPSGGGANTAIIDVTGQGIARGPGFSPTFASYALHASGDALSFTVVFGNTVNAAGRTAVPDGGTTLFLLGSALTGLGLLRRKLA